MRRITIGRRLFGGFGLIILLVIAMASMGVWALLQNQAASARLLDRQAVNELVANWARQVEVNANQSLAVVTLADPELQDLFEERMHISQQSALQYRDAVKELIHDAEAEALFEGALLAQKRYVEPRDLSLQQLRDGEFMGTRDFFRIELPQLAADYADAIGQLSAYFSYAVEQQVLQNQQQNRQIIVLLAFTGLLALLAAATLAWRVTLSITRPLQESVRMAAAVAGKDLSGQIQARGKDELAALEDALSQMVGGLRTTVSEVRSGATAVATAAGQISAGSHDLSVRTEQQAATLTQTAATVEQFTASVRQNADNAHLASTLAEDARKSAGDGGSRLGDLVESMSAIHARAEQVGTIVGVIDSIAFQTNILALNAAVEAARAGEQGRGFAVVATEVRALAQRSANAAKEIKNLIENSLTATGLGNEQAALAIEAMNHMAGSITKVSEIMAEISVSSSEQASGIDEINRAVGQMDDVTRQNSCLVEQSAAAAASLEDQATRLADLVAAFRLGAPAHKRLPRPDQAPAVQARASLAAVTLA